jgi:hypothetical protein
MAKVANSVHTFATLATLQVVPSPAAPDVLFSKRRRLWDEASAVQESREVVAAR